MRGDESVMVKLAIWYRVMDELLILWLTHGSGSIWIYTDLPGYGSIIRFDYPERMGMMHTSPSPLNQVAPGRGLVRGTCDRLRSAACEAHHRVRRRGRRDHRTLGAGAEASGEPKATPITAG